MHVPYESSASFASRRLSYQWAVLILLLLVVVCGAALVSLCRSSPIPVRLKMGEEISVPVFRVHSAPQDFSLNFTRSPGQHRPELGSYAHSARLGGGTLSFPEPGEQIKLAVRVGESEILYEAMPATSFGETSVGRRLVPFVDDGNPNAFAWDQSEELRQILLPGRTTITVSVVGVDRSVEGETASLVIHSPVTLKGAAPQYRWLWWFTLWPVYACVLALWGSMLAGCSYLRARRRRVLQG